MNQPQTESIDINKLGKVLLRISSLMQSNGAFTALIRSTIDRIAANYGYQANLLVTQKTLSLTVTNDQDEPVFNSLKRISPPAVNFKIISGICSISWEIKNKEYSLEQLNRALDRFEAIPHYPRWILLTLVGIADAGFCGLAGGNSIAMIIAFMATIFGLFIRQEAHKMHFNPYLCVFLASLAASLFAGYFKNTFPEMGFDPAFATSVLFLIPGVPLINSFTDLLDGNILNGILRAGHGLIISFMIALGLVSALLIYNF